MYDLIIKSGTIVDGTRFPRYRADIGIRDGKVAKIGTLKAAQGRKVIDATGLIVAPGHIDCHTHYDAQINWDPYCSNSGENGVTTVIAGNCGFGFAPCRPEDRDRAMLMMDHTEQIPYRQMKAALSWDWITFPDWMDHLRALPKGVNLMMYVPMNPLLVYVMGIEAAKSRRPTQAELTEMKQLIREGMAAGACGLAFSFLGDGNSHVDYDGSPMPSDIMHADDAVELSTALAEIDAGVIQVLSLFGPTDYKEIAVRLSVASLRPILLNALLLSPLAPGITRPQVEWLAEQNRAGHRIYGQALLQHQWQKFKLQGFDLNNQMPEWAELCSAETAEGTVTLLKDEAFRQRMRDAYDPEKLRTGTGGLEPIKVTEIGNIAGMEKFDGKTIGEIATETGKHPLDAMMDIVVASNANADFSTPPTGAETPQETVELMMHPLVLAGTSDGGAHSKFFQGGQWATELVQWLGREEGLVTLEELHYRLAYQQARVMGLTDRGAILEGNFADLIIYDYEALRINSYDYEDRYDMPEGDWRRYIGCTGYRWIVVNGQATFQDGVPSGALPGQILSVEYERATSPELEDA